VPADDREGHHLAADGRFSPLDRGEAPVVPAREERLRKVPGSMAKPRKLVIGAPRSGEKDESEVRWLISYSDFMMQLVCLFILLYSVSFFDKGRMARIAAAYRASVGLGDLAALETKSLGDRLAVGDRPLLGGDLGGGDVPKGVLFRVEP